MVRGQGGFTASDLTNTAHNRSAEEIRSAVIHPDKNGNPGTRIAIVTTHAGSKYSGVDRNEDNFSLQLQSLDGAFHLFLKSELQSVDYQPQTPMPVKYQSELSPEEIDDLVAYLISVGEVRREATGPGQAHPSAAQPVELNPAQDIGRESERKTVS